KKYRNPVQAQGENIANAVYNALGIGAPKSLVYQDDKGRMTFASEIIPNTNILGYDIDREEAKAVLKGFAADVLMANWDAVGLEFDNIVFQKGNKNPIRIDNGAAFLTRAQGEYKPSNLLDKVTEYENFQDKNINPTYSQIFKKAAYTKKEWQKEFKKQVADIIKTRKKFGDWTKFVSQFPTQTPQIKKANIAVGKMLEIRTNKLAKLAQKM
ncbi:MAG TPA: hypothetical protein PLS49_07060, partial [Candidatus Woesebacteria bacterium]|nr:hypothetical protein [Candidatus Woesebacteria bacterium]